MFYHHTLSLVLLSGSGSFCIYTKDLISNRIWFSRLHILMKCLLCKCMLSICIDRCSICTIQCALLLFFFFFFNFTLSNMSLGIQYMEHGRMSKQPRHQWGVFNFVGYNSILSSNCCFFQLWVGKVWSMEAGGWANAAGDLWKQHSRKLWDISEAIPGGDETRSCVIR